MWQGWEECSNVSHYKKSAATYLIIRRTERDLIKNVHGSSCKVPLFLPVFNETRIFSTDFGKLMIS